MSEGSHEHRIRTAIGKMFHHKHRDPEGKVDLEGIASENGVSYDQVREQIAFLKTQNYIAGPIASESGQVAGVPAEAFHEHGLTDSGLAWAEAGYPVI